MIRLMQVKAAAKNDLADINRLLPQLAANASMLRMADYRALLRDKNNFLYVAKDGRRVVGMAMLVLTRIPTGLRGWVEEVVVDKEYRGQGLGARLCREVITAAKKSKVRNLKLTSSPSRAAANKLYRRLGFKRKITNVYKMELQG